MRCSKLYILGIIFFSSSFATTADTDISWVEENKKKQEKVLAELKKNGVLAEFEAEHNKKQTEVYRETATRISNESGKFQDEFLSQYDGLNLETTPEVETSKASKALFLSFSLSDAEMKSAFIEAGQANAEIYFNGLHPDDKGILDTMLRLKKIAGEITDRPIARFHPKAFKQYNVNSVPTMLLLNDHGSFMASGLLNFDWLENQAEREERQRTFGKLGPTKKVIEISLLDEIAQRVKKLDVAKMKKNAVKRFWSHQKYAYLPTATENKTWYIDPTVKVNKDIISPKGHVIARQGDIVNPLRAAVTNNMYIVFDATQPEQVEWAKGYSKSQSDTTKLMLMTNQFDANDGWTHLAELRKTFNREIYLLPIEMVNRFKLTALPVKVETDSKNYLLKIQQYKMEKI